MMIAAIHWHRKEVDYLLCQRFSRCASFNFPRHLVQGLMEGSSCHLDGLMEDKPSLIFDFGLCCCTRLSVLHLHDMYSPFCENMFAK